MKIKEILIDLWCACLFLVLGLNLLSDETILNITFFKIIFNEPLQLLLPNFLILHALMFLGLWLRKAHPVLRWSWMGTEMNINVLPLSKKYISIFFVVLLIINLPSALSLEENWFRRGTTDWADGILRSIAFGMAHIVVAGVPVGIGVAFIFLGIWLTYCYFLAGPVYGVIYSTLNHTAFNLIACTAILFFLLKRELKKT